jgi:hypothetical protein
LVEGLDGARRNDRDQAGHNQEVMDFHGKIPFVGGSIASLSGERSRAVSPGVNFARRVIAVAVKSALNIRNLRCRA